MNLENVLSEVSHRKRHYRIPRRQLLRAAEPTETEVAWWVPGAGEGKGSECFTGTESQSGKMGRFWGWMVVTVVKLYECTDCPELHT